MFVLLPDRHLSSLCPELICVPHEKGMRVEIFYIAEIDCIALLAPDFVDHFANSIYATSLSLRWVSFLCKYLLVERNTS